MVEPELALFTVGYAGRTSDAFVALLEGAGIERVVDVRAMPASRQRGFSKGVLAATLAARGIDYVHVPAAGNPFRGNKSEAALALYSEHIDAHPEVLREITAAIRGRRSALLCLEHDPVGCHRTILARRLLAKKMVHEVREL